MGGRAKQLAQGLVQRTTGGRIIWRGPARGRRLALTFDDGPDELTPRYLEVLADLGVPATFFVMGCFVEQKPGSVDDYLCGGHQLAGHGYYHKRFTQLRPNELRAQLSETARALGPRPEGLWVRPPHGAIGARDVRLMLAGGYTVAMWSLDSGDHEESSPAAIAARCSPARVCPGDVLLFHEGQSTTLAALPIIIGELRDAGYDLVTMATLMGR